jgi:hypothetical protein|tara:strand:- start:11110 stop:11529 length:420 start_codon:yes stop_codon:yes gene_type:complete
VTGHKIQFSFLDFDLDVLVAEFIAQDRLAAKRATVGSRHAGLARSSDPVTSHEAAAKVQKRTVNHKRVLELLVAHGPMTDLELLGRWRDSYGEVPESTPRKRRCDLVRMGLVEAQQDADGQTVKRRLDGSRRLVWGLRP